MSVDVESQQTDDELVRAVASRESATAHRIEVTVEVARVRQAFDRAYRNLAKQARVKGFRPGKVPQPVLERMYGASLAEEIERTLVQETLGAAIGQTGLEPVAQPEIDAELPSADVEFRYTARIEVKPEIELGQVLGLAATKPPVDVSDADVESNLEELRLRNAPLLEEPEATAVESGHILSIDFVGRVDGEPFEGGSGRDVELEVGSSRFIPGFEDQLVGACAGEDRIVRVSFPEDYPNAELAGKDAEFDVHVGEVKRRQLPALDDEFAKDVGDFETIAALRQRIRSDLTAMHENRAQAELRRTLMDSLIERHPFDVPPGMAERALERRLLVARQRLEGSVVESELEAQLGAWREEWRPAAEREVRESLLLEAVARDQQLETTSEEVDAQISALAAENGVPPERLSEAWGEAQLRGLAERQLTDRKALDFLAAGAKVVESAAS